MDFSDEISKIYQYKDPSRLKDIIGRLITPISWRFEGKEEFYSSFEDCYTILVKVDDYYLQKYGIIMRCHNINGKQSMYGCMIFDTINNTLLCNYSSEDDSKPLYNFSIDNIIFPLKLYYTLKGNPKILGFNSKENVWKKVE